MVASNPVSRPLNSELKVLRGQIEEAISAGNSLDTLDDDGSTLLMRAISMDDDAGALRLLDKGAGAEARDARAVYPLRLAAEKGMRRVVKRLLSLGASAMLPRSTLSGVTRQRR